MKSFFLTSIVAAVAVLLSQYLLLDLVVLDYALAVTVGLATGISVTLTSYLRNRKKQR